VCIDGHIAQATWVLGNPFIDDATFSFQRFGCPVAALAIVSAHIAVFAHEVTHTGTVVALKTAKYAQPNGGSREVVELEVAVVDPKTRKAWNRVFTITEKTRFVRAGKPVKIADVSARKG
jgi:hypothetical protein